MYKTRNKLAKTAAASKLKNDFILCFGSSKRILQDQGREFEN